MTEEEKFLKLINTLARSANFELDVDILSMYDKYLSPFGYELVNRALEDIFVERDSRDPFPSVAFILKTMRVDVSDKSVAEDCANRILGAIQRYDYTWPMGRGVEPDKNWFGRTPGIYDSFQAAFESNCGELGWAVVQRMGGYSRLCEEWRACKNMQVFRAQIRESAKATIELSKAGKLHIPPALPEAKGSEKVKQLIGNTLKKLPGGKDG